MPTRLLLLLSALAVAGCASAPEQPVLSVNHFVLVEDTKSGRCYTRIIAGAAADHVCQTGDSVRYSPDPPASQHDVAMIPPYVVALFETLSDPDFDAWSDEPARSHGDLAAKSTPSVSTNLSAQRTSTAKKARHTWQIPPQSPRAVAQTEIAARLPEPRSGTPVIHAVHLTRNGIPFN